MKLILSRLDQDKYTVLNDLLMPTANGKTSQIDHVVVSPYGLFVIETKNYRGWITGTESSQYWTQTIYKRKEKLYNPIWQNNGHIKALQELLSDLGELPFVNIVAFSTKADLKVKVSSEVVYFPNINRVIKKHQQPVIPQQTVKVIIQRLRTSDIGGKEARKKHVEAIRTDHANRERNIRQGVCPRCGGQLVQRKSKNGAFTGCSGYPKCRFTRKGQKKDDSSL